MKRFSYLGPRLVILALIAIVVWSSSDAVIENLVVYHAQQLTGARMEVGQLRFDQSSDTLYLKELEIADPSVEHRNLLQSQMASLKIATAPLPHRRVVVKSGRLSQVIFGASRTKSGWLDDDRDETLDMATEIRVVGKHSRDAGQTWLDSLPSALLNPPSTNAHKLQSEKLAQQFAAEWEPELRQQHERVATIAAKIDIAEKSTSIENENPLRDFQRISAAGQQTREVINEIDLAQESLAVLRRRFDADRIELADSLKHDRQQLQLTTDHPVRNDGDVLNQLLLADMQHDLVSDVVRWFHDFRGSLPAFAKKPHAAANRGTDVIFAGATVRPGLIINQLEIDGQGKFANQHFNFAGHVNGFSDSPEVHDQPIVISLRAQSDHQFTADCTLDRRGGRFEDHLTVHCPEARLGERKLGDRENIVITMAPGSVMAVSAELNADGDNIDGVVTIDFGQVSLYVDSIHEYAGGRETAARVNEQLSSVTQFSAETRINGPLNSPAFEYESSLGSRVATAIQQVANNSIEQNRSLRQRQLQRVIDSQVKAFDRQLTAGLDDLEQRLNDQIQRARRLESTLPMARAESNGIR